MPFRDPDNIFAVLEDEADRRQRPRRSNQGQRGQAQQNQSRHPRVSTGTSTSPPPPYTSADQIMRLQELQHINAQQERTIANYEEERRKMSRFYYISLGAVLLVGLKSEFFWVLGTISNYGFVAIFRFKEAVFLVFLLQLAVWVAMVFTHIRIWLKNRA